MEDFTSRAPSQSQTSTQVQTTPAHSSSEVDSEDDQSSGHQKVNSTIFKVLSHPSYPVYIAYQKRLASLAEWKYNDVMDPNTIATAGFFYAGYSYCVRCFQCGLGLRSWKQGDDIYEHHRNHRPSCPFLHLQNELRRGNVQISGGVQSLAEYKKLEVALLQSEHRKLAVQLI